jgi:hypothetical protein
MSGGPVSKNAGPFVLKTKNKNMKPIFRSYLTEVFFGTVAPGNGSIFNFPDIPEIQNCYVCGVQVVNSSYLVNSPSGRPNITLTSTTGVVLSLMNDKTKLCIYQYPLVDLTPNQTGGYYRDFEPFKLNLVKSYITVIDNVGGGIAANTSACFNFLFMEESTYKLLQRK